MPPLLLHTFKVDVTPPVGGYLCGGLHTPSLAVEEPIYLRGIIFSRGSDRYVIAGINYCYLSGRSYWRLVEALAAGANIPASQATLHADHVHDVPLVDEEAHALLEGLVPGGRVHDEDYFSRVLRDTRAAVARAVAQPGVAVGSITTTRHAVDQFASNRRVMDDQGKCHVRWSVCRDEWTRSQPEGRIDPNVSQLTFFDAAHNKPFACINWYTSHPQVSDGSRRIGADTVGVALTLFERNHPNVFPLYFAGCAGDITAGKYTTLNRERNRLVFGLRLYDGIEGAFNTALSARRSEVESLGWADHTIQLPLSRIPEPASYFEAIVRGVDTPVSMKYLAAMKLDRLRRKINVYPFRVSRLRLGPANLLFLPTELLIEYQFHARGRLPGPVLVAAYGDSFLKYVAHDKAFEEGGYEIEPLWSEVEKGVEQPIKAAIDEVLAREI